MNCLYILEINPLSVASFSNIFSHSEGCLFILFMVSFAVQREKTQINRIRNEKGEVTTDTAEIQGIMKDYYKQLHANKMDNLEEMDKFLEEHNLPRQTNHKH